MMWKSYHELPLIEGLRSYATRLEKLIFIIIKAKVSNTIVMGAR